MKTKLINSKQYVFCEWRRKFVRLTPEEYVRQRFLWRLVEEFAYPKELIAVEVALQNKRADAIVYDRQMQPLMIIEFKADTVAITQKTLDQATNYNRQVQVPYLILHNGMCSVIAHITQQNIAFAPAIPTYGEINRTE